MKILMIAVFSDTSTNNSQANGFEKAGAKVIRYNYRVRSKEIEKSNRDSEIINICKKEKPDFIFFSKANDVDIRVILECNKYSKTLLWYMDPMENWNYELIQKIKYSNIVCCALRTPYYESLKYNSNSFLVHEGFDSNIDKPYDLNYKYNVTFIGHPKGERSQYINSLGITLITNAYNKEHAKVVSQSKINLNFVVNQDGISDRVYKILAAKGFLLTQKWPFMEKDFTPEKDFVTFNNLGDLAYKIEYYLTHDKEREQIAKNGYKSVQKYNRNNFAKRIIEIYENTTI